MWSKICKAIGIKSQCLIGSHNQNQIASESVQLGAGAGCEVCVEESQLVCKCAHNHVTADTNNHIGDDHQANSSFAHAVINMTGMLIGLGQLSTPYALENGGWSSAFLLIVLGIICAYSSLLLGKCLDKNPKSKSYSDIGQQAFGAKGRVIVAIFIYLEIFMTLVSYTISLHDNIITVFSGVQLRLPIWAKLSTSHILTILAVLVALPSLWLRNLSSISFLSFGGILMSAVIFSSVACTAIFGGVRADHKIPVLQLHKIPAISGLYIFSYAGHIVFPNLYVAMKDPSKFTKVTIVSFTLVTTLYTLLAFLGAKLFGPQVNSQITLSMPPHFIATKIALWATVLTPITKYALEFAPIAIQLEHSFPASMSSRAKMIVRGFVGSFLLLVILALALLVPYFEHVLGLTGSLLSIGICVIFPCAFYIKIYWGQISKSIVVMHLIFIGFGAFLGVLGTISSSKMLIESMKRTHPT
ncbi:Amino acid transporter, transmembrane domain containing protein [Trema orientale]|uniref:Amino acid transporter, transmembrane domain containing protein n=1 Tax=Trema orientale TaxID=63057 RepID=A0A2P5FCT7_TREOI|nr:Amino acid transporter, transmembrane domain containing protein [Trema orientale]